MKSKKQTVPVSERALVQRINRRLAKDGERLKAAAGMRARLELGAYFVMDISHNCVLHKDVDLEELGRELEVLRPYESLVTEGRKR